MSESKIKKLSYLMMAATVALMAVGGLFQLGIVTMYVSIGVPLSIVNIFLVTGASGDVSPQFKRFKKVVLIFYGLLFLAFTLTTILVGLIFSGIWA